LGVIAALLIPRRARRLEPAPAAAHDVEPERATRGEAMVGSAA
jgi:hypothetical protein